LRHGALLQLVEILSGQLSLVAASFALHVEGARLGEERQQIDWSLKLDKVLSRAAGIVAARRKYNSDQAFEWLKREAVLHGQPVWRVAEGLIENHEKNKTLRWTA